MRCPNCKDKKGLVSQIFITISGSFLCKKCGFHSEQNSKLYQVFDWLLDLVILPASIMFLVYLGIVWKWDVLFGVFIVAAFIALFVLWFFVSRYFIIKSISHTTKGAEAKND